MYIKFKNKFIIFLILLQLLLPVITSSTIQGVNNDIIYGQNVKSVSYSTSQPTQNGEVTLTTSYFDQQSYYASYSTFNGNKSTENYYKESPLSSPYLYDPDYQINDFNYFVQNGVEFLFLSTYSFSKGTNQLIIINMHNNNTFIMNSFSIYNLSYITNLGNYSYVYFSFYNSTMFSIVRYNIFANIFSFFLISKLPDSKTMFLTNEFTLFNKLYLSYRFIKPIDKKYIDYVTGNTSLFILNDKGVIFNKTFNGLNINTFTPFENGLLLHSAYNNRYYKYFFQSGEFSSFSPSFQKYQSIITLYPFDNNSFILLNSKKLVIINIHDSNANSFLETKNYNLNQNVESVQPFKIRGYEYLLFKGIENTTDNNYKIEFFMIDVNNPPATNIFLSTDTTSLSYYISSNSYLIILVLIGVAVVAVKKIHSHSHSQQPTNIPIRSPTICSKCGAPFKRFDNFCENCGTKI